MPNQPDQPATIPSCQCERPIKRNIPLLFHSHIFQENLFSSFSKRQHSSQYKKHKFSYSIQCNSDSLKFFFKPRMTSCRQLEVRSEDQTPQKWCVPLTEDVFGKLMSKGSPTVQTVFGDGSLFSPWLFGKFFDPSDAFPLWDFESDVLLSKLRSSSSTQSTVDWLQTDSDYVLKSDLPGKCLDVCLIQ